MKILNKIWGIGLLALLLTAFTTGKSSAQGGYISNQDFYDELSPYGTWVNDLQYGDVWIPDAEDGFRPYATRGHWVLTEYGNTWVSDYPWGWATFHYGRWHFDEYYGWMWVPDNEWGPAWVNWREGGGYYGWAPLSPGISINIALGNNYNIPDNYWTYAPETYINSPRVYDYYVPRTQVVRIVNRTTIINNTVVIDNRRYVGGPRFEDIRRSTRQDPQIYRVNDARRPGTVNITNNTVNIYKPNVRINNNARPSRIIDGDAYRRANPDNRIANDGRRGVDNNRANMTRLAATARSEKPDDKIVRVNTDRGSRGQGNDNNASDGIRGNRRQRNTDPTGQAGGQTRPDNAGQRPQSEQDAQQRDARRQQAEQNRTQRQQQPDLQDPQQRQQFEQQRETRRQQAEQNRAQRQQQPDLQDPQQRQQFEQQRETRRQQAEQNRAQRQQQPDQQDAQQRQQFEQQREARRQQNEQQQQQRQQEQQVQRDQQRQQQNDQQQQQRRQEQQMQRDQQRQQQNDQQQQQRRQEQQMQRDQQRQQQQVERQQQPTQPQGEGQQGRGRRGSLR